jgi:hypothetical protein
VTSRLLAILLALCAAAPAQEPQKKLDRGIMVRPAVLYLQADERSSKLGEIDRGREVTLVEKNPGEWLHVFANLDRGKDVTGWIKGKGVVLPSTPNGDRIVYGEAVDSEAEASRRGGRRRAEDDAARLYYRVYEYFPQSSVAAEALYRAADIRWQIEKSEVMSRPSAKERDARLRRGMDEELMRLVKKKFPGTKWADLADFQLIDNKLCGDWQGLSKCPEDEAERYEEYAREHPNSPKLAEALYEAARRYAALITIYQTEGKSGEVGKARSKAMALVQRISGQAAQTDWGPRAQRLGFLIEQSVPLYGAAIE